MSWALLKRKKKKKGLLFFYSIAKLFILQLDTMFLKLCSDCSHAFSLTAQKKGEKRGPFLEPFLFISPWKRELEGVDMEGAGVVGSSNPVTTHLQAPQV